MNSSAAVASSDRALRFRYLVLTVLLTLPLLWAFLRVQNLYPFTSWTVMMSGGSLERPWTYYVVKGETIDGASIDIQPAILIDALYDRSWSVLGTTISNEPFKLGSPHPANAEILKQLGPDNLPAGARVPELLRAWGNIYNSRLPPESASRIKAVRVEVYRWESGRYDNYHTFVRTWRQEL